MQRIQGDPTLCRAITSLRAIFKALKDDGEGYLITNTENYEELGEGEDLSAATQQLLEEFEDLCQPPMGLPHLGSMTMQLT